MKDNKLVKEIEFNYDNLGVLNVVEYLLNVVINDIQFMNDTSDLNNDEIQYLNLGNNNVIKKEDYESICSIVDTIYFVKNYNKGDN